MEKQLQELKDEAKEGKNHMTNIVIAIMGSLLAFMFYGRIQDSADIVSLKGQVKQHDSELEDVWNKYNDAGTQMMDFMINDAREKEQIKELIKDAQLQAKDVELSNLERWLNYWKEKSEE
jgi:predicted Holliday junction resolvase-like endonuclease